MTETKNETLYYFISEKRKQALKKNRFLVYRERHL